MATPDTPGGVPFPRLRPATNDDLTSIANVAVSAFDPITDPVVAILFPAHLQPGGKLDSQAQFPWRLGRNTVAMKNPNAMFVVLEDVVAGGETGIVGYALAYRHKVVEHYEPPSPIPPTGSLEAWNKLKSDLDAANKAAFGEEGLREMWYLSHLAVHADHQRKGHGYRLLNWVLERMYQQGRDLYLVSTPSGLKLYTDTGFEKVGMVDLGGVPHTLMVIRSPRQPEWDPNVPTWKHMGL